MATARAWEEKAMEEGEEEEEEEAEEADAGVGVISASISGGANGDLSSFLETVLSDCNNTLNDAELVGTGLNQSDTFDKQHCEDDDDTTSEGEAHDTIADVPLLARKDCTIGRCGSTPALYLTHETHATMQVTLCTSAQRLVVLTESTDRSYVLERIPSVLRSCQVLF